MFLKQSVVEDPVADPVSGEKVSGRISEMRTTIDVRLVHRSNLLQTIAVQFEQWNLLKEKVIYRTLNMLSVDVTKKCLVAESWCPVSATNQIQNTLQRATINSNSQIGAIFQVLQIKGSPPTYFPDKQFCFCFSRNCGCIWVSHFWGCSLL